MSKTRRPEPSDLPDVSEDPRGNVPSPLRQTHLDPFEPEPETLYGIDMPREAPAGQSRNVVLLGGLVAALRCCGYHELALLVRGVDVDTAFDLCTVLDGYDPRDIFATPERDAWHQTVLAVAPGAYSDPLLLELAGDAQMACYVGDEADEELHLEEDWTEFRVSLRVVLESRFG